MAHLIGRTARLSNCQRIISNTAAGTRSASTLSSARACTGGVSVAFHGGNGGSTTTGDASGQRPFDAPTPRMVRSVVTDVTARVAGMTITGYLLSLFSDPDQAVSMVDCVHLPQSKPIVCLTLDIRLSEDEWPILRSQRWLLFSEASNIMKFLVTGGAGFIGSNLVTKLLSDPNNEVICIDNMYCGLDSNVAPHLDNPRFKFIKHDITEPLKEEIKVDRIYHLAAPASPPFYQRNAIHTAKTMFLGTLHMLELATKTGARFLLTSTSEVYGDPEVHPQKESYWGNVNCNGIRSCYDEGKRIAETLTFDFHRQHKTDVRIVRIFNTYGPGMREDDGRVVPNFIRQALEGKPLTVYGEGNQTRSFCFVQDTLAGIMSLMEQTETLGPVNVGNPIENTMLELAETILKVTGGKSSLNFQPLPSDDPRKRKPDITLAKQYLNWEPKVLLEDGLKVTVEYFKKRLNL
ncbi:nucleoside-diphosphate-sugar epimerase [Planoprotostelium fungivorum]|uniref:UDP-glucuronic acid decarboxylase 1 n=1 Tax=Planoprotostelium fungivorum TaxID=1890364 RepID=A0A2P6NE82_9EUKA|nr:nucleoside-diphosphate-sugar epimerase [Planoprotostelium fungivorum]